MARNSVTMGNTPGYLALRLNGREDFLQGIEKSPPWQESDQPWLEFLYEGGSKIVNGTINEEAILFFSLTAEEVDDLLAEDDVEVSMWRMIGTRRKQMLQGKVVANG